MHTHLAGAGSLRATLALARAGALGAALALAGAAEFTAPEDGIFLHLFLVVTDL